MTKALVTGGNRGIGREVARQLAAAGMEVVIGSRDLAAGEAVARELAGEIGGGATLSAVQLDVTDAASVAALPAALGSLDVLINNAGAVLGTYAEGIDTPPDVLRESFEINTIGAAQVLSAVAPLLRASGHGRVVNVSSGMGQLSEMGGGVLGYRMSKAALNVLTSVAAIELADDGVLVNSVCPGWVATDLGGPSAPRTVDEGADTIVWLAQSADDGPTGGFFRDRAPIAW